MWKAHKILCSVAALALSTQAATAAPSEQFDLICKAKSEQQRYRIDLAKGEWCIGECKMVQKIAAVTTGMLTLADHQPQFARDARYYTRINRVSGEWEWFYHRPGELSLQNVKGTCEPAPFSGTASGPVKF